MILAATLISDCVGFMGRHPGLLLVLLGVIGEVACDWKEMEGRLAQAKKFSALLLILGLLIEFWESAKSDEEIARLSIQAADSNLAAENAAKEAALASGRAASTESNNLALQIRVLELKAQMQETKTNLAIVVETANETRDLLGNSNTTAVLKETKENLAAANKVVTDVRSIIDNSNLATLKITSTSRTISPAQGIQLITLLKPYFQTNLPRIQLIISVEQTDFESVEYGKQIEHVLKDCGASVRLQFGMATFDPNTPAGFDFAFDLPDSRNPTPEQNAIMDALRFSKVGKFVVSPYSVGGFWLHILPRSRK